MYSQLSNDNKVNNCFREKVFDVIRWIIYTVRKVRTMTDICTLLIYLTHFVKLLNLINILMSYNKNPEPIKEDTFNKHYTNKLVQRNSLIFTHSMSKTQLKAF